MTDGMEAVFVTLAEDEPGPDAMVVRHVVYKPADCTCRIVHARTGDVPFVLEPDPACPVHGPEDGR